jgi:hypothetical protein
MKSSSVPTSICGASVESEGAADGQSAKPMWRPKRRCRWLAYHMRRTGSFVRLGRVASMSNLLAGCWESIAFSVPLLHLRLHGEIVTAFREMVEAWPPRESDRSRLLTLRNGRGSTARNPPGARLLGLRTFSPRRFTRQVVRNPPRRTWRRIVPTVVHFCLDQRCPVCSRAVRCAGRYHRRALVAYHHCSDKRALASLHERPHIDSGFSSSFGYLGRPSSRACAQEGTLRNLVLLIARFHNSRNLTSRAQPSPTT